ncbi:uncharacterized protein LOC143037811 [Oratosquilla oratoria]|uniref:uncharacterized protein LOC143037811 n=1 Tax=Oratosquilla oratoria TaxID=337810 RepID=UPI003F757D4F
MIRQEMGTLMGQQEHVEVLTRISVIRLQIRRKGLEDYHLRICSGTNSDTYFKLVICYKSGGTSRSGCLLTRSTFQEVNLIHKPGIYTTSRIGAGLPSECRHDVAILYMETLEKDRLLRIVGRGCDRFRYVDDTFVVLPEGSNVGNKLGMLIEVDENIQFTVELEVDHKLPFLNTMIHRGSREVIFSLYRTPTSKDHFIHYLSRHSARSNSVVVIGFYLRGIRICIKDYLEEEMTYTSNTFCRLLYPLGLLNKLKRKAADIYERFRKEKVDRNFLVVPYTNGAETLTSLLCNVGIHVAYASGRKIKEIVRGKEERTTNKDSVAYSIPCGRCSAVYYGEKSRGIAKKIGEHKNDIRH